MLIYDDLVNDIARGCKPESEWRVGIEHEQFAFNKDTGYASYRSFIWTDTDPDRFGIMIKFHAVIDDTT